MAKERIEMNDIEYLKSLEIENIEMVEFCIVLDRYKKDHNVKDGEYKDYEITDLNTADKIFNKWVSVRYPVAKIGEIILPHHKEKNCCAGREEVDDIIDKSGVTLEEFYTKNIESDETGYKNTGCYKKVVCHKSRIINEGAKSMYFTTRARVENIYKSFQNKQRVFHLDGLHRLIAIMCMPVKPVYIDAFIAIDKKTEI